MKIIEKMSLVISDHSLITNHYSSSTLDAQNPVGENIYGSHPFYIELRDGTAHGVVSKFIIGEGMLVNVVNYATFIYVLVITEYI